NAWADYDASGAVVSRYLFDERTDGHLARWSPGEGTRWYLKDALHSTRAVVGADGQLAGEIAYDSFGNPLPGGSLPGTERYGFTGRESAAGGLGYYRSRYYLPDIGRFGGEDGVGCRGSDLSLSRCGPNARTALGDPTGGGC